jgi:hypothetical protein
VTEVVEMMVSGTTGVEPGIFDVHMSSVLAGADC